ncbi:hypothetical protein [Aquabacterium humicola]|uniref:hypothetical protein n=1 Tax=Aquabacterium humicola TaxID=3237377 RepID=UPI0025430041|nr:hypothetical protein [Rubrivivax pictus]
MEHTPHPLDLELPGAKASPTLQPAPVTPIGEMRTPTWNPVGGPGKRSYAPLAGVAALVLGVAAAVGLYVRHEAPPKTDVAMAPQAGEPVTLPLPAQNPTPPVTDLPAVPPAPAAADAKPAETAAAERSAAAAAKRDVAPNPTTRAPTRAERSSNATAPAAGSTKIAEAALKPQPVEPSITPAPMPAPAPAPSAEPPAPASPSTPSTPSTPPSE